MILTYESLTNGPQLVLYHTAALRRDADHWFVQEDEQGYRTLDTLFKSDHTLAYAINLQVWAWKEIYVPSELTKEFNQTCAKHAGKKALHDPDDWKDFLIKLN